MTQFKSKFYRVLILLYSIVSIGSTIYLLFRPNETPSDSRYEQTKQELLHIKEYLKQKDSTYQKIIDSLETSGDNLRRELSVTDEKLFHSRLRSEKLSNTLTNFITARDSSGLKDAFAFDSLSDLSERYVQESEIRDSLCEKEVRNLTTQVELKSQAFSQCDSLLGFYREQSTALLANTETLNLQLNKAEKKNKRSRNLNRLLSASAMVLTGIIVTNHLLH